MNTGASLQLSPKSESPPIVFGSVPIPQILCISGSETVFLLESKSSGVNWHIRWRFLAQVAPPPKAETCRCPPPRVKERQVGLQVSHEEHCLTMVIDNETYLHVKGESRPDRPCLTSKQLKVSC